MAVSDVSAPFILTLRLPARQCSRAELVRDGLDATQFVWRATAPGSQAASPAEGSSAGQCTAVGVLMRAGGELVLVSVDQHGVVE